MSVMTGLPQFPWLSLLIMLPLGGALLSAEILYLRDFELEAIVPGFIASVVGYTIFASWSGWSR